MKERHERNVSEYGDNDMAEIAKTYSYHKPSEDGLDKIRRIREAFSALDALIQELAPASRERSVALTNLETTAMWAIKAIVVNDPQSEIAE